MRNTYRDCGFCNTKKGPLGPFLYNGGEGGITQNSLRAALTLRASPLTRLGAKCSVSRIWSNPGFSSLTSIHKQKRPHKWRRLCLYGGEGGIRTLDTRLTYTPLAGERLQPLGHVSFFMVNGIKIMPPVHKMYSIYNDQNPVCHPLECNFL